MYIIAEHLSARHLIAEYWLSLGLYICLSVRHPLECNWFKRYVTSFWNTLCFFSVLMPIAISTMWLPAGARGRDLLVSRLGAALQLLIETDTVEARVEQAHRQRPLHAVILVASLVCNCLQHQLLSCLMIIQVVSTLIYILPLENFKDGHHCSHMAPCACSTHAQEQTLKLHVHIHDTNSMCYREPLIALCVLLVLCRCCTLFAFYRSTVYMWFSGSSYTHNKHEY